MNTIHAKTRWFQIGFSELLRFRWVLYMLIVRDIKLRYKQTFLGISWVALQPIATTALFCLVFGHVLNMQSEGAPYILFAFSGLVPWLFFSQALQRASTCLINDTRLITKVYFPRLFIPLSATFGLLIDFAISLFLYFALFFFLGHPISNNLLFLPIPTLVLFAFSIGINLLLSAINVFYRDFKHIIPFLVQFWMYASPLVYSSSVIPERFLPLYILNPLVGIIDGFRYCLLGTMEFPLLSFSIAATASFLLLIFGTVLFRKIEPYFADFI